MDVDGNIVLIDLKGNDAAVWSFSELLSHWNRKHAFAAYVPYTLQKTPISYRYDNPVLMCEHTDFQKYLKALCDGLIVFDPGSKVTDANTPNSKIKARSQFRISLKNLNQLYEKLTPEIL